jgi:ADP-heptose:LPS heptosyltransferase
MIQQLDLTIGVDTSVVHLAGALGRPVWVLLPFAPDWRWLLHREDSPWYPTMHLVRQPQLNDWHSPIVAIRNSLVSWLEMGRNPLDKKNNIRKDRREA